MKHRCIAETLPNIEQDVGGDWSEKTDVRTLTDDAREAVRRMSSSGERARLLALSGPRAGQRLPVGELLLIGRSSEAQLRVEGADISRKHAKISRVGERSFLLEDLQSRNGTMVNGTPVRRHVLRFGDAIHLGQHNTFLFTYDNAAAEQLQSQERFGAAFELAKGVAHNFNNAMAVVLFQLSHLRSLDAQTTLGDGDVRDSLDDMSAALQHLAALTRSLIDFARLPKEADAPVDLVATVREVLDDLSDGRGAERLSISAAAQPGAQLIVSGDVDRLHRALLALCREAAGVGGPGEAGPGARSSLRVVLEQRQIDAAEAVEVGVRSGLQIVVRIIGSALRCVDEGRRAFEPFRGSKEVPEGRLELAAALGIIQDHGGVVSLARARAGDGGVFTVFLPDAATK